MMRRLIDLNGQRFGRLVVIGGPDRGVADVVRWHCRCDCGNERLVRALHLRSGHTVSCGCFHRQRRVTHGASDTKTYRAWWDMLQRCRNPKLSNFRAYGGRGIRVCDRWQTFENFLADMGECPAGRSLDRIDNDGNYEPGNCRWATREQQHGNLQRSVKVTIGGETKCLKQWARHFGIHPATVRYRIRKGWPAERALTTPPAARRSPQAWL